jgi:hypothetical protein
VTMRCTGEIGLRQVDGLGAPYRWGGRCWRMRTGRNAAYCSAYPAPRQPLRWNSGGSLTRPTASRTRLQRRVIEEFFCRRGNR